MDPKLRLGYALGLLVTIAYSVWYIGLNLLSSFSNGAYSPVLPLFLIELISALIVLAMALTRQNKKILGFDPRYSILAGVIFAAANYMFFVTISSSGIPFAGSFATAEIVVFSFLLWASSKTKRVVGFYVLGAALIAAGLIIESFKLGGGAVDLNATLVEYGTGFAVLYGLAAFFYYISLEKTKDTLGTMLGVQGTQTALFLSLLCFYFGSITLPSLSLYYIVIVIGVAIALFLSFFGETVMVEILIPFGRSAVSTGYILASLQLIPVLIYSLAINPGEWVSYTPGIALIVMGSVFLQWK